MAQTAADVLIDTIHDWGVDTIFGLPGDGINGIMEALRNRQDRVRFVQVRHEEAAAFMACGYAKFTGRLGVCLATSGPGGIHLLNGLYDAKLDQVPVLALTGMAYSDLIDTFTQQDVELDKLYMDVSVYNTRIMGPAHVENVINLACRAAIGQIDRASRTRASQSRTGVTPPTRLPRLIYAIAPADRPNPGHLAPQQQKRDLFPDQYGPRARRILRVRCSSTHGPGQAARRRSNVPPAVCPAGSRDPSVLVSGRYSVVGHATRLHAGHGSGLVLTRVAGPGRGWYRGAQVPWWADE